jgi:hypothetical protein
VLDPAVGSGAFLVAACRYLADAYEAALIRQGGCSPTDFGEAERAATRRTIAERCLFGVDVNPMAVQLARLSVWLATLAGNRPLSFLDHRLIVGDSVLGTWLTSLRRPPLPRRRCRHNPPLPLFGDEAMVDALREALPVRFALESTPSDTIQQVREKERTLAALSHAKTGLSRWMSIANLWCAAWFDDADDRSAAKTFESLVDHIVTGRGALSDRFAAHYLQRSHAVASRRRFLHWELAFPEVFFDAAGTRLSRPGFDAVIGNPPWDMIRADAGSVESRGAFRGSARSILRFSRESGVYTCQSDGHANQYQLFVERAVALTRGGGRIGLVLPSGFAVDHGNAALRQMVLERCDVDALVGVDNKRGIFPIHRSVRFLLLSATAGPPTTVVPCRFGVTSTSELESLTENVDQMSAFPVRASIATLERVSGPALAIPNMAAAIDLAICDKAASLFRPLGSGGGWHAQFGRELNGTDDKAVFLPGAKGIPIVDGKHVEPFRVALHRSTRSISAAEARARPGAGRLDHARLAYRDVASASNRLTLIAAILPAGCVSTHTVFCLRSPLSLNDQHLLCGLFNSLVVNYLVRLRVTTHVTTSTLERLPIPTRDDAPAACSEIAGLARLLARRQDEATFAALNARVAELYQLSRVEFEHVLSTFPLIAQKERDAALDAFTPPL